MRKPELTKYRVVCQGVEGEIALRARAKDKYEAFEQIVMFLRARQFDYQVVLVELCGPSARS